MVMAAELRLEAWRKRVRVSASEAIESTRAVTEAESRDEASFPIRRRRRDTLLALT